MFEFILIQISYLWYNFIFGVFQLFTRVMMVKMA